jgi:hypothetical protein
MGVAAGCFGDAFVGEFQNAFRQEAFACVANDQVEQAYGI